MIYQVMPDLSADEFAELKADILARGVMVPVEYDEHGNVLDGHHRIRAVTELRAEGKDIAEWPRLIRIGWTDEQKRAHARALNLARRHLTRDQREQMWIAMRQDGMSYRQIAEADGTAHFDTVRRTVANATVDLPATVTGKDGKKRVASKPRTAFVSGEAVAKAESLPEAQRSAVLSGDRSLFAAERQAKDDIAKAALHAPVEVAIAGIQHGDFRELSAGITDNSVDLIFTDPPYDRESIPLFGDAARIAARILKPGGSLICYVGQLQLPEVLPLMAAHLRYWWCGYFMHSEPPFARMQEYGVIVHGKPMLWFTKGARADRQTFVDDVVSGGREKGHHPWQQSEAEAAYYIENLTAPGGLVVDFFLGGGTTAAAAQHLGRRWIGFEISGTHVAEIQRRLQAA